MPITTGAILGVAATFWIWVIATTSAEPRRYYNPGRAQGQVFEYPLISVVISCMIIVVEGIVLWLALNGPARLPVWRRASRCAVVTIPLSLLSLAVLIHSPPYIGFHIFWLWTLATLSSLVLVVGGLARK